MEGELGVVVHEDLHGVLVQVRREERREKGVVCQCESEREGGRERGRVRRTPWGPENKGVGVEEAVIGVTRRSSWVLEE